MQLENLISGFKPVKADHSIITQQQIVTLSNEYKYNIVRSVSKIIVAVCVILNKIIIQVTTIVTNYCVQDRKTPLSFNEIGRDMGATKYTCIYFNNISEGNI